MTVKSIEKALGALQIKGLVIDLQDGATIDVVRRGDRWAATYSGRFCVRVADGQTAEEAIANAIRAGREAETT